MAAPQCDKSLLKYATDQQVASREREGERGISKTLTYTGKTKSTSIHSHNDTDDYNDNDNNDNNYSNDNNDTNTTKQSLCNLSIKFSSCHDS